jgi:prevent-host-death family protein
MRTVSIRELANETTQVIVEATATEQPAVITNRGVPVALLIPLGDKVIEDAVLAHARVYVESMEEADRDLLHGRTQTWPSEDRSR